MDGVMSFLPLDGFPALFPNVVAWVYNLETQARESGPVPSPI
jgi:hypothetical protein